MRSWSELPEVSESRCAHELTAAIVSFTYINVSQGSVATLFRWGEIVNNHFIANFPQSVPMKEFLKLVNIWRRYGQKYGGMFTCSVATSAQLVMNNIEHNAIRGFMLQGHLL